MNIRYDIKPKKVELKNREGKTVSFCLRMFEEKDAKSVIDCIKEEYGDTYFKRDFYNADWLIKNAVGEHYVFFLAQSDDEIAGMTILTLFRDGEDYIEPASQIIRKKYRGCGLSEALVYYVLPAAESMKPSSLFVHAVTFHDSTQTLCEAYGMVPVGFRLGSFLAEKMQNSYETGKCEKYSEGIMIKPVTKTDAGTIYVPVEIRDYTDKIYRRLNVNYNIVDSISEKTDKAVKALPDESMFGIKTDNDQRIVIIDTKQEGSDLADRMNDIIRSFGDERSWVIQLTLDINSPAVCHLYDELKKIGFFFAGLKPLCGQKERMYMQWIGDTSLNMEEYVLTDSFDDIRHDIEKYMYGR